jgi:hypothetical protein
MGIAASAEVSPTEVKITPDAVGDMNADQKIDATDALLMLKFAVGKTIFTTQQETYADVDESGKVDVSDALMVLQYSVGKRSVLPLADAWKYVNDPQIVNVASVWASEYASTHRDGKVYEQATKQLANRGIYHDYIYTLDAETAAQTIVNEQLAGKAKDVYEVTLDMCRDIARMGGAADIFASPSINKQLFRNQATASVTFGGKVYGVARGNIHNPRGVLYNKELIARYAPDYDIMQLYKEGQWTFDKFAEIAVLCTKDTDGNGRTDIYGFTSNNNVIDMVINANAGGLATMVDGKVLSTFNTDAAGFAVEWCKDLYRYKKAWGYRADNVDACEDFTNQKAAMLVSYLECYPEIVPNADFAMEFVPMPKGPNQTEYIDTIFDTRVYLVPTTKANRLDVIGHWLNGMAKTGDGVLENQLKELEEYGFSEESRNNYQWLVEHAKPDYSSAYSIKVRSQVWETVTTQVKHPHTPAKMMKAMYKQAQKELDEYYGPLY